MTTGVLHTPFDIGGMTVRNRLYRAPVLEGAGDGDDAAEAYARQFVPNAEAGVGLIIQGSSCILPEGRTSPGMTCFDSADKVARMAPMVAAVHAAGAKVVVQLGHGGLFAMEAWHEPYASQRVGPLLAASRPPRLVRGALRGVPVHVLTTDEVGDLARRWGQVAAWARDAGYDGVQLGSANAKLLDQFLSPFYNRRDDEFGGSLRNRARILERIRVEVAAHAGDDFPCLVKVPVETAPFGMRRCDHADALELASMIEDWGFDAVTPVEVSVFPDTTLSRGAAPDALWKNPAMARRLHAAAPTRRRRVVLRAGAWWGGKRAPFRPVWNRALIAEVRQRVGIPVLAVGGIRTTDEVVEILERGDADLVGIGRPFYAEPDLPRRILGGDDSAGLCSNANTCVAAQMLGMRGGCYNPDTVRLRASRSAEPR